MASKKPLLSPIPEIPEVFSFVSSPDSPKANALWSGNMVLVLFCLGLSVASKFYFSSYTKYLLIISLSFGFVNYLFPILQKLFIFFFQFSSIVPDGKCASDPSDCFQQGEEAAGVKEAEESDSLVENKKLQGSLLNEAEQLTRIEFLEEENSDAHEGAQRTWCPQEDSVRGSAPRRRGRRSSTIYFPPVEKLEVIGNSLPVSSFNIEEVFSVPQPKKDSLEPFRRKSENSGEKRVRRSMRFHKDAEMEGLAWVQVPDEVEGPPLPASGRKTRRTVSMATLTETIHPREQNPIQFPAPGKENKGSVHPADGPCRRWRRKSLCVSTPQETRTWSQTRKRSVTHSVCGKDRSNQKHCKDVET
ncbi:CDCA2 protein, partial [Baryphthengus martii]|nr:CDCA2 protein [Baryphthengus martii]